jgi:transposase-like protein
VESLLPLLYLKGISTGDFSEALAALFGKDAVGLSASTIGRLKDVSQDKHAQWQKRHISGEALRLRLGRWHYLEARLEDKKQCILVLIGATPQGRKELVGFTDGARESAPDPSVEKWRLQAPPRYAALPIHAVTNFWP